MHTSNTIKAKPAENDRNVMLNVSNANGPRQISIVLPSEYVNIYENGLPVVYRQFCRWCLHIGEAMPV